MMTQREEIIEVVNKLFVYTDRQDWDSLLDEVFTEEVDIDIRSIGGEEERLPARELCQRWENGFEGLDAVHHLAGNHIIDIEGEHAEVFVYANATHYKESAQEGQTREFVGSYDLHLVQQQDRWKIDRFRYHLKYMAGNVEMK